MSSKTDHPKQATPSGSAPAAKRAARPAPKPAAKPAPAAAKPVPAKQAAMAAKAQAAQQSTMAEEEEDEEEESPLQAWLRESPSWLTSLIVHMAALLVLALATLEQPDQVKNLITSTPPPQEEELEEFIEPEFEELDIDVDTTDVTLDQPQVESIADEVVENPSDSLDAAEMTVELDVGIPMAPKKGLLTKAGTTTGSGLSGRGRGSRAALVGQNGGSKGSEEAVALALRWLAEHQMDDGGWSFDHTRCRRCGGKCSAPGKLGTRRTAATAMALLPFLGAGQTHKEGDYQRVVHQGLYFLGRAMKLEGQTGNLMGGGAMYDHGLASIVLCEAYGMTQDPSLRDPAQLAVNFIVTAQDPVGGGWRYRPKQAGDTSVVGWQIMALKSAHMAYLHVPPETIRKAEQFLDSVQQDSGAFYGYTTPGKGSATTAVGLLCRMYLGWKKEHPAIERGAQFIADRGPMFNNLYRDYYASQVMFQATSAKGDMWDKWNTTMRDGLVNSQSRAGHETGSWNPKGSHADHGGRLYATSMSTMILEVYYRHMPIFKEQAVQDEFPLD